jgi:hypothetical protein
MEKRRKVAHYHLLGLNYPPISKFDPQFQHQQVHNATHDYLPAWLEARKSPQDALGAKEQVGNVDGVPSSCSADLLLDAQLQVCNRENQVTRADQTPTPSPVQIPTPVRCCPAGYSGLRVSFLQETHVTTNRATEKDAPTFEAQFIVKYCRK